MKIEELRKHPGYIEAMEKIRRYSPGFQFTVKFSADNIPRSKANALRIVMRDAVAMGLLESVSIGLGWDTDGEFKPLDETYRRTGVASICWNLET